MLERRHVQIEQRQRLRLLHELRLRFLNGLDFLERLRFADRLRLRLRAFHLRQDVDCLRRVAAPLMNVRKRANRRQVVGRDLQDGFELLTRFVVLLELHQRAPERDLRREIPGMARETVAAHLHRLLEIPTTPVLLGELRERDRARVLVDPAAQLVDTGVLAHA